MTNVRSNPVFSPLSALINDLASTEPPNIHFFTPFIYHLNVHIDQVELLIPSNQGNWIDCRSEADRFARENSKIVRFRPFDSAMLPLTIRFSLVVRENARLGFSLVLRRIRCGNVVDGFEHRRERNSRPSCFSREQSNVSAGRRSRRSKTFLHAERNSEGIAEFESVREAKRRLRLRPSGSNAISRSDSSSFVAARRFQSIR